MLIAVLMHRVVFHRIQDVVHVAVELVADLGVLRVALRGIWFPEKELTCDVLPFYDATGTLCIPILILVVSSILIVPPTWYPGIRCNLP